MLPLRLPTRSEVATASAALIVLLFCSWLRRGQEIAALKVQLAAKPMVEERVKEVRVEGPVHIVEKLVREPSGACSIERTTDRAPVTTSTEREHEEHPACPAPRAVKGRYAGVIVGSSGLLGSWVKGARGGLNVFDTWDLGGNVTRERGGAVAVGGDVTFRF